MKNKIESSIYKRETNSNKNGQMDLHFEFCLVFSCCKSIFS